MDPTRRKKQTRPSKRIHEEEEEDWEEEEEEEDWEDPYLQKLKRGRQQRGQVRRYLREETTFFHDITVGPCKKMIRGSCSIISNIMTFFAVCFFFGAVIKISYTIYSFFG